MRSIVLVLFTLKHFQGRSQKFSRGTQNFPNPSSPLSRLQKRSHALHIYLAAIYAFFCAFLHCHSGVKKKKSVVLVKYISTKQIGLEELRNIVLF